MSKDYDNITALHYAAFRPPLHSTILDRCIEADRPYSSGLDVGCGTGANIAALAGHYTCVGCDTSKVAISLAKKRFPDLTFTHGFAPGCLTGWLPQTRFILLMDVLEHVEHADDLLRALADAVQPGTFFFITVPANPKLWSPHDEAHGHFRRYTANSFSALIKASKLQARFVSHYNARLYPPIRLVRKITARRGHTHGDHATDLSVPPAPINRLLERIFASEAMPLTHALTHALPAPFSRGVSLLGILQKPL